MRIRVWPYVVGAGLLMFASLAVAGEGYGMYVLTAAVLVLAGCTAVTVIRVVEWRLRARHAPTQTHRQLPPRRTLPSRIG